VRKATQTSGMLHPILNRSSLVPTRTRINLLKMYIIPILTYAGAAATWAPYVSINQWRQLEAVQTISARMLGTPSYVRNDNALSTAKLTKLKTMIRYEISALFYKNRFSRYHHIRKLGQLAPAIQPRLRPQPKTVPLELVTESTNI